MGVPTEVTPLCCATGQQPLCFLLRFGGVTFLLDCGWDDGFSVDLLQPLITRLPEVDAVLLSHPDTSHVGALPYLVGKAGLKVPVYGTLPVVKMGTMTMYDHVMSRQATSDFTVFDLDDVDAAFAAVKQLKFMQRHVMPAGSKCAGIALTPYAAGHLVGGAVWGIQQDGEEVVYAVGYNHQPERHLNATQLGAAFSRPALLITDATHALERPLEPKRKREDALLGSVMEVLRQDGSVLMPVEAAGRMLELLLLLDAHWADKRLPYPLVLLTSVAYSTLEFARSMLEWMHDSITKSFITTRDNPFSCRHVRLCHNMQELDALPQGPRVVLASGASLEAGLAQALLLRWGPDPRSAILFTQAPPANSYAATLLRQAGLRQGSGGGLAPLVLQLNVSRRVPLEGVELEAYERQRAEEEARQAAAEAEATRRSAAEQQQPLRASSSSISRLMRDASGAVLQVLPPEAAFAGLGPTAGAADADGREVLVDGFVVPQGAAAPMFPDDDEQLHAAWDAYGEVVDAEAFGGGERRDGVGGAGAMDVDEAAAEEEAEEEVPIKVVTEMRSLTVAARIARFFFDGLADTNSVQNILTRVAPRHLMLVGTDSSQTTSSTSGSGNGVGVAAAAQGLAARLSGANALGRYGTTIHTPAPGEVVRLELSSCLRVLLSEQLLALVRLHAVAATDDERYSLAYVEGMLADAPADDNDQGAGDSTGSKGAKLLLLPAIPEGEDASTAAAAARVDSEHANGEAGGTAEAAAQHGGIFIGNVQLSNLKQELAKQGISAEFRMAPAPEAGSSAAERALMCAGAVLVRRAAGAEGKLVLEGPLSDDYHRVRDVVLSQFQIC